MTRNIELELIKEQLEEQIKRSKSFFSHYNSGRTAGMEYALGLINIALFGTNETIKKEVEYANS